MSDSTLVLHGTSLSGHTHRVVLLLRALGLPYAWRDAPVTVRQQPEFLALNPLGQIPVLQDGEVVLADSNAILVYLCRRYNAEGPWLPEEPVAAATVQRWLSIAAGEVMYGPAIARMISLWNLPGDLARAHAIAARLLTFMQRHLDGRDWLASDAAPTIADLACYAYVAHAPEGRISLEPYPLVQSWLTRVETLPFFVPLPRSPMSEDARLPKGRAESRRRARTPPDAARAGAAGRVSTAPRVRHSRGEPCARCGRERARR